MKSISPAQRIRPHNKQMAGFSNVTPSEPSGNLAYNHSLETARTYRLKIKHLPYDISQCIKVVNQ